MSHTRASSQKITPRKASGAKPARKTARKNKGLPLPLKRLVRFLGKASPSLFGKQTNRKALWASGSAVTLALLAIVPGPKTSQAIANSTCQQVIKSGAEISRSQLSSLLAVPKGASPEAVRQVINEPYCLLPATNEGQAAKGAPQKVATREAYPLAFDREAWVVVNYSSGTYVDYDFVFKH